MMFQLGHPSKAW